MQRWSRVGVGIPVQVVQGRSRYTCAEVVQGRSRYTCAQVVQGRSRYTCAGGPG